MLHDEDFEEDRDEYILIPSIKDLHVELIEESIKDQINNGFGSSANFVEAFSEEIAKSLESNLDEDVRKNIEIEAERFYCSVIDMVDSKFKLDVDLDQIAGYRYDTIQEITEALYQFFIIDYAKNIKKFYVKYITENQDMLGEQFELNKRKDVSTISFKKKIVSRNIAIILSNINSVIEYINDLDIDPSEFISYFNNERYEVRVISDAIDNFYITGNFVPYFLSEMDESYQGDEYDTILLNIQNSLYKKNKRAEIRKENDDDGE